MDDSAGIILLDRDLEICGINNSLKIPKGRRHENFVDAISMIQLKPFNIKNVTDELPENPKSRIGWLHNDVIIFDD